jgi:hypothetical protein
MGHCSGSREVERFKAALPRPDNATDLCRLRCLALHVEHDLAVHPALVGDEPAGDLDGVAQVPRRDIDHQRLEVRRLGDHPPSAVRRGEPALRCRRRQQVALGARGAQWDTKVVRHQPRPRARQRDDRDRRGADKE